MATITAIGPCPPIAPGEGNVVIGRFVTRHVANLVRVELDDGTAVQVTGVHPFWSAERAEWVRSAALQPGEPLDGLPAA